MSLEEDVLVQENIQEFVHDDNKIVTCKWLSLTLSISVISARKSLCEFVEKVRNEGGNNDDINVTYFVSGFDNTADGVKILKCIVVPEPHLDSVKKSLDPVTSCHVYSVQKSQLKDYTPLYQADYDIGRENVQALSKFSPISCPCAVSKPEKDSPVKKSSTDVASAPSSTSSTTLSSTTDAKKASNKKGGIASMFAAVDKKEKKPEKESKAPASKSKDPGEKKGIQAAFKKTQPPRPKTTKEKEETVDKSSPDTKMTNTDDGKKTQTDKGKKHKLSEKDEPPRQQKRRRIRNDLFDSSDDEEKNKSDDDDDGTDDDHDQEESDDEERAVSPSKEDAEEDGVKRGFKDEDDEVVEVHKVDKRKTEEVKVKDESKGGKKRKRTRKLVPRQYIDEDGFMVTEKVWESDSTDASDQEELAKTTKPVSPAAKGSAPKPAAANKKKAPAVSPSKNKQMSLMSFFKKK